MTMLYIDKYENHKHNQVDIASQGIKERQEDNGKRAVRDYGCYVLG